jgi:death-on-curing protein
MMIARFGGTDGVRDEGLFESALARPSNIYHYDHNAQITQLAAAYAGGIIQNHPFVDGNEVSATTMTLSLAASEVDENDYGIWLANNIEAL